MVVDHQKQEESKNMNDSKCEICRRAGLKLFLKSERCLSPKCPMIKRSYAPGQKGKRRRSPPSEYGKELREKQKLKSWYNLEEIQFKNYVKKVLGKKGRVEDTSALLIKILESRLDNVVFRLGLANSRTQARQLVSHGHILVNGKSMNVPSHQLKKGDVVAIKPSKIKKPIFQNLKNVLKKYKTPNWLQVDAEKMEGKIIGESSLEEAAPPVEISAIFEYYSR